LYYVYIATNKVNNKKYVGVTNNFNRRLSEHKKSTYDFGKALRLEGIEAFYFELIEFETVDLAYEFEGLMVTLEESESDSFYNMMPGGIPSGFYGDHNPMRRQIVKDNHPALFTKESNPMNKPELKQKMIESQARKSVLIKETIYPGVREAARKLGMSRQKLVHRLKSDNFPDHQYWDH
jgi:group I intron endonuclease